MAYQYTQEELYGRALFSIQNNHQSVSVAFEPIDGDVYMMIIYADDGGPIDGHHEHELWDTLFDIMNQFSNGKLLEFEVVVC